MNPNCPEPPPRQKIPKDGFGPRGYPECYYTSRVLNSTARYVRFVKKLRQMEEEIARGVETLSKEAFDKQYLDFFIRCDRRGILNDVEQRVELCLQSYEHDLKEKRKRLKALLTADEQKNIRAFAEQTQAGAEAAWQDKQARLRHLLAKRQKEHEDKYKDTPLSKCAHVLPCLVKIRAKEAEDIQLYQMREKQMRKMAELEMDKMWQELAMKESEALAARIELDAIERHRRDTECKLHTAQQLREREQQRQRDRELLKQEALNMKEKVLQDELKEAEAERKREEFRLELAQGRKDAIRERQETVAKQEADDQLITDTWDSLAGQGLADEQAKEELRRKKERELDLCNSMMAEMKHRIAEVKFNNEPLVEEERRRRQDAVDLKRCHYRKWSHNTNKEVRVVMKQQIAAKQAEAERARSWEEREEEEHSRHLTEQLEQLVQHKQLTDAQARRLGQRDLLQQIDYNRSLKERARQEAELEAKKCKIAAEEYQRQIANMLRRPFYSDDVHPFMKQMVSGLTMPRKCPCSPADYCLDPPANTPTK